MTNPIADPGEGHSPAAWTGVTIMLVALFIAWIAFFVWVPWLLIASIVLFVIGPIAGLVLSKAGYGVRGPKYQPKEHGH
ncbi:MAG: HGxxPAAW family protein [Microbacterium sp.]